MGRMYTANVSVSVSAVQDFFEIVGPSDAITVIHKVTIIQSSEAGDANAEMLRVQISRSTGTSGSGGSTLTPRPHEEGDSAYGGTVEANNTTQATTTTVVVEDGFHTQAGWVWRPDEGPIVISPSGRVVVEIPAAPSGAITMQGSITFEEIGG